MSHLHYPQLAWRQTKPGYWEREIDEAERFYTCLAKSYEGSGRMYFAITGFVSISVHIAHNASGHDVEEALRQAWLRLRYNYPTIASRVNYDSERGKYIKSYTTFDPKYVDFQTESWLSQTFLLIVPNMTGLDWCNSDPLAPKFPTLFVITPPYTNGGQQGFVHRDLVLRAPHDIIDGIGTLQLLNKLLEHAAKAYGELSTFEAHSPGSETKNLSPPLRVAAAIPPVTAPDQQRQLQNINSRNAELRQDAELLTVPFNQGQVVPGKHQRAALTMSIPDTTRILQACKDLGITVTHVYHASIAIVLRDLQPQHSKERSVRYINYCLINERSKCIPPYNTTDHTATVYHSVSSKSLALDLTIPATTDVSFIERSNSEDSRAEFLDLVHQVKDFYTSIRDAPDNLVLAPSIFSQATPHISTPDSKNPADTPVPAPNPSPSISISSMGKLDSIIAPQHGAFMARDPWVTGEELGTGIGVFLGTWQGKLQLSAAYNEAWHDREQVRGLLQKCCEVVWRGLGVESAGEMGIKFEWMH